MRTIFKHIAVFISAIVIVVLGFIVYFLTISKLTPYLYEEYAKIEVVEKSEKKQYPKSDSTKFYGDEYNNQRIGVLGTFGDSAGFMNAFFSFLAFSAVVITIVIQNKRDNKTDRHSNRSQFENVFFNMTSTFEEIVSHLEYGEGELRDNLFTPSQIQTTGQYDENGNPIMSNGQLPNKSIAKYSNGRELFRYLYCTKQFTMDNGSTASGIKAFIEGNPDMPMSQLKENLFDGTLDHYFRYAYRIFKYVDESELITEREKYEYASVFRAQFSCYELLVLFLNCIDMDNNKFKHLIEKYCVFNNIRSELLPETPNFYDLYEPKINSEDGKERDGYAESAEHEYAITAFCKPAEHVSVRRLEIFQKVWELRFSKRIEQE